LKDQFERQVSFDLSMGVALLLVFAFWPKSKKTKNAKVAFPNGNPTIFSFLFAKSEGVKEWAKIRTKARVKYFSV
jgi:hypothetical protein